MLRTAAVATLCATALLTACGDDAGSSSDGFAQHLDAVCQRVNGELAKLRDAPATKAAIADDDAAGLARTQRTVVAITTKAERAVAAIDPPAEARADLATFVSTLRRQADATERIADALEADNRTLMATVLRERGTIAAERIAAAKALGSTQCGRP